MQHGGDVLLEKFARVFFLRAQLRTSLTADGSADRLSADIPVQHTQMAALSAVGLPAPLTDGISLSPLCPQMDLNGQSTSGAHSLHTGGFLSLC